ncbi:hypothetical protein SFHH103_03925 [Sinorhizobium fredii HH103]|uniref:Uncharacterized protein n=1 Tax=Sinorhizobium fredii (strain HH103) TaxID=1117943 RepID=G9A6A6_SINF1|nr:hypothetical protein [Sinorhizobium fredii]CCE98416.1 hypothetical protein SFHH103_03925 [Sinorhizobium fredii HH103]
MHHKKLSNYYAEWIDNLFFEYADRHRVSWQPIESYIQCNGFFITFAFNRYEIGRRKSASNECSTTNLSPEFYNVDCFYKSLCRKLLGRKYFNKRDQQPLMIAAADVNGTRYNPRPYTLDNVHIHSLWLLQPGQKDALKTELDKARTASRLDFEKIHAVEIDRMARTSCGPSTLSSYTMKFLGANAEDMRIVHDVRKYPEPGEV